MWLCPTESPIRTTGKCWNTYEKRRKWVGLIVTNWKSTDGKFKTDVASTEQLLRLISQFLRLVPSLNSGWHKLAMKGLKKYNIRKKALTGLWKIIWNWAIAKNACLPVGRDKPAIEKYWSKKRFNRWVGKPESKKRTGVCASANG
jgi:hypothetical protein